jgi:hypothetical protein
MTQAKKKNGRKLLKIDPRLVEKLAAIQCSHAEMAAVLGCSADTLERRFAAVIKKGRETGKSSLKRAQFKLALSGNPTMLIWLGKQYLGQADKQEVAHAAMTDAGQEVPMASMTEEEAAEEIKWFMDEIARRKLAAAEFQDASTNANGAAPSLVASGDIGSNGAGG